MKPKLSKKLIIVSAVIIIVTIIILSFFLKIRQETTTSPAMVINPIKNPSYAESELDKISYTGPVLKTPEKLAVYKNKTVELETSARGIATKLNLPQSSFSKTTWVSSDKKTSLSVDKFNNRVLFSVSVFGETQGKLPTITGSEREAKAFLASLGFSGYVSESPKDINYYLAGIENIPTSPEKAEIIVFWFEQKLDNLPAFTDIYTLSDIVVWTGRNNKVTKAEFPTRIDPEPAFHKAVLVDFKTTVSLVENKKGGIIEIATERRGRLVEKVNLDDINLTTATLEYRLSLKDNLIYPYYRFEGTSRIKETGEQAFVTIIIPAVEIPQD